MDTISNGQDLRQKLCAVFTTEDLEWKVQTCGKKADRIWALVVPYISARAIQSRLDDAVGPGAWRTRYEPIMKAGEVAGFLCYLSLRIDGEWIEKCDGAELTDIEPVKGGISNALKRCAVQWGMGRYLYSIPTMWADIHEGGKERAKTKDGEHFNWDPPQIAPPARQDPQQGNAESLRDDRAPDSKPSSQEPPKPAEATEEDVKAAAATLGSWDRSFALKLWEVTKAKPIGERLTLFIETAKGIKHFKDQLGVERTDEWLIDTMRAHGWPQSTPAQVLAIASAYAGTNKPAHQLSAVGA